VIVGSARGFGTVADIIATVLSFGSGELEYFVEIEFFLEVFAVGKKAKSLNAFFSGFGTPSL
jgi:hypothetical protein